MPTLYQREVGKIISGDVVMDGHIGKRRVYSMDKGWSFRIGGKDEGIEQAHCDIYERAKAGSARGAAESAFNSTDWEAVDLPHDWSVKLPFDEHGVGSWGFKPKGSAWYRRVFYLDESFDGKQLLITFEGVAKDATVYFNGSVLGRNYTAYAPFTIDITDRAHFGKEPNILAVFVDANGWEGWWYEGAGIYRHVDLTVKSKCHVAQYGVFVKTEKTSDTDWNVNIQTDVENTGYTDEEVTVEAVVTDKNGSPVMAAEKNLSLKAFSRNSIVLSGVCADPFVWDIDTPDMYKCTVKILKNGEEADCEVVDFGFRTISIDSDKGFFLNGRHVELFGTCNHQDHGGVGVAVPDSLHEYRIKKLKEMGSNAYRCAHGMPSKELLDECDRQGLLVMDENRNFETGADQLGQLRKMVLRDRNHPCVVMYSLFNEEPLQYTYEGKRMAKRMREEVRKLDDTRFVTAAMNGGILEDSGAGSSLDIVGINYQSWAFDDFRNKYPDKPVVCSETTSYFTVRGCTQTDLDKNLLADYDENCSDWGNTVRDTWKEILKREYLMGGFMWTGFDYLGEPTPCPWPAVSSYFGMMDICGNPKSGYWLSRAIFKDEKVCKALPHWSFDVQEGEMVRVLSCTNCDYAEVFVNGRSFGRKAVNKTEQAFWEIPFEKGTLKMIGCDKDGREIVSDTLVTAGAPKTIKIVPYKNTVPRGEAIPVDFVVLDENGIEVPTACFETEISCTGGRILGTSNGDPNCHEAFDSGKRSVFNGRCQAIVSCDTVGKVKVVCIGKNGVCGECEIECTAADEKPQIESVSEIYVGGWRMTARLCDTKPDPHMVITDTDMNSFEPVGVIESPQKFFKNEGKWALYRTTAEIPEALNGKAPTLIFYGLWGDCEVYIGGKLVKTSKDVWAAKAEIPITKELSGKQEITVTVGCINKSGAGICKGVVIR